MRRWRKTKRETPAVRIFKLCGEFATARAPYESPRLAAIAAGNLGGQHAHQPGQDQFRVIRSEEVRWKHFPSYPPAARTAVLVGDPTQPGPYAIRVWLPHDTKMMPHRHTEDRIYVVISGVFYIGLGDEFDESKLTAHAPGTVVVLPSGQSHFHWAKSGEYITQVTAIGPLGLEYVDRTDDPRSPGKGHA